MACDVQLSFGGNVQDENVWGDSLRVTPDNNICQVLQMFWKAN